MSKPAATPERDILRAILIYASTLGAVLFRNPRGVERIACKDCARCQRQGRILSYGLANGAPDLIGWMPHTVTPQDVGRTLGVLVGIEGKAADGRVREDQRKFLTALIGAGAVAGIARSVADVDGIVSEWKRKP